MHVIINFVYAISGNTHIYIYILYINVYVPKVVETFG